MCAGPYHLLQQVGEGGMGVVHLAIDSAGRAVAVKVLRPHVAVDSVGRERLAREVRAMRRVRGAHVAEVLDADVDAELPYVVTRYVSGRPLNVVVREIGPLALPDLLRLAHGLADALVSIHEAGVVHRDLKPANVLLADGVPVVIDFGISQLVDDTRLTSTGLFIGTPGYFAPEIARGEPATPASDVASWAATIAFAATGKPPYGQGPVEVVLANVAAGRYNLQGVPDPLPTVLSEALLDPPEERPSAGELRDWLEKLLADPTVVIPRHRDSAATQVISGPPTAVLPGATQAMPEPQAPATARVLRGHSPPAGSDATSVLPPEEPDEEYAERRPFLPFDDDDDAGHGGAGERPAPWPDERAEPVDAPRGGWPLALGLLALLAAAIAVAPLLGVAALLVLFALLYAGDAAAGRLERRRATRGRRRGDATLAASALPWHLGSGLVAAAAAALVGAVAGAVVGLVTALVVVTGGTGGHPVESGVEAGAVALAAVSWFGPGSYRYRAAAARCSRRLGRTGRVVLILLLLAGAAAGFAGASVSPVEWWPAARPNAHQWIPPNPLHDLPWSG